MSLYPGFILSSPPHGHLVIPPFGGLISLYTTIVVYPLTLFYEIATRMVPAVWGQFPTTGYLPP